MAKAWEGMVAGVPVTVRWCGRLQRAPSTHKKRCRVVGSYSVLHEVIHSVIRNTYHVHIVTVSWLRMQGPRGALLQTEHAARCRCSCVLASCQTTYWRWAHWALLLPRQLLQGRILGNQAQRLHTLTWGCKRRLGLAGGLCRSAAQRGAAGTRATCRCRWPGALNREQVAES